jgi:hypothetical protein
MSSLTMPSVTAALPAVNVHPHGHGHKKGSELDPTTDTDSSTAAQIPVGSAQNMFGSLFSSLTQILGGQPAAAASSAATSATTANPNAVAAAAATAGSKINLMA